jgi:predicted lipoprotein with Yx(FWY)xxD motif
MRFTIRHSAKVFLSIAALAIGLALAACGSDDEGGDDADASAATSGAVAIQGVDGEEVLVDSEGRTLYSADVEEGGRILCTGACTSSWDPTLASANEAGSASNDLDLDLGTVKRPDGAEQLSLDGLPLYTFTEEGPGELTGDGFVDEFEGTRFEWKVASAAAGAPVPEPESDAGGGGLY